MVQTPYRHQPEMSRALVISALAAFLCLAALAIALPRHGPLLINSFTRENCSATTYCPDGYHCCTVTTCCPYGYYCCGGGYYCCSTSRASNNELSKLPAVGSFRINH